MKKIADIYQEYELISALRLHQLNVAAVADQICESFKIPIDRDLIITAALFHDMGNVVKFNLEHTKSIFNLSDEEIINIKKNQDEFIKKYGENDHEANMNIACELGLSQKVIELISGNRFENLCIDAKMDDWSRKVLHYADSRVGPTGILSYEERMDEAHNRYKNSKLGANEEERQRLVGCGKEIEKQIFSNCKIKPEDINNDSIKPYLEKLKKFEV